MSARLFAFLRAINTGGRRLTNDRLLAPFHAAGFDDVAAYQAAGNVAFRSDRNADELAVTLSGLLEAAYGFDVPVFVRDAADLSARLAPPRFAAADLAASAGREQITFLATAPTADQRAEVMSLVPALDKVVITDTEWFWLPVAGISESALPITRIERILGPMTMRTVGTVERMLARYGA